jgi:GT2 family glycosyltransferase/glycosyltransferase involved in cell wall biosynthesis
VLEALIQDAVRAIDEGRITAALRFVDRAGRIGPNDLTSLLLHARLLLRLGKPSQAAERLRFRQEPEAISVRAEALFAAGSWQEAGAYCEMLLERYAVDGVQDLSHLANRVCGGPGDYSPPGWIGIDSRLRLVGAVREGIQLRIAGDDRIWAPDMSSVTENGLIPFQLELSGDLRTRIVGCANGLPLLGSNLHWPPDFGVSGWVVLEGDELHGEVKLDWMPMMPVVVTIGNEDRQELRVSPSSSSGGATDFCFRLRIGEVDRQSRNLEVLAVLPDGSRFPLCGSPVRRQKRSPIPVAVAAKRIFLPPSSEASKNVDVIIPVYRGRRETLSCIMRVLATTNRKETEVLVINDASPDKELCANLAELAQRGEITLLTNDSNLGFPGAVNRGMELHPTRDVVLLNADAEVFNDWLVRLKRAAYSSDDIATVTPLGDSASIASYPGNIQRLCTTAESERFDEVARRVNTGKMVDLPVGVGFCLYVKRACVNEIGMFDTDTFGKGYGEENDFCLRGRSRGWRHVAASDVFVRHQGARSYGRTKSALMKRNRLALNALHPGYDDLIAGFVAADPLLESRRAIDIEVLSQKVVDPVLLVTLALPGGVRRHVEERSSVLEKAGHTVLILQPRTFEDREHVIVRVRNHEFGNLVFELPREGDVLRKFLRKLGLSRIELHHFVGLPPGTVELVAALDIPYSVYIHDYSWICPRLSLIGKNGSYCGEPAIEQCEDCIQTLGTALEDSLTVRGLRIRSTTILNRATEVVVPCRDLHDRLARYFPGIPIKIKAWEEPIEPASFAAQPSTGPVRVAIIGAISVPKGYQILLDCALDAAERGLNLEFVVIGYTSGDEKLLSTGRVFITGPYQDDEVRSLLDREQPHVAFLPSVVPETWSYVLSHALRHGLRVVAFDLGAVAGRLRTHGSSGGLLPLGTSPAKINDAIMRAGQRNISTFVDKEPL